MESDRIASYYRPSDIQGLPGYPQPVYRDIQQYMQQVSHQIPPLKSSVQSSSVPPPSISPQHLSSSGSPTLSQAPLPQLTPQLPIQPPGKDRSRPRGRMTPYAFFVQERRESYRRHGVPVEFTAFSKECSSLWKGLTEEEKARYQRMSEDDKERYRKESATYQASLGHSLKNGGSKRGRKRKEPGQPKRNMCAFLHFCAEKRPKLRGENPAASIGALAKQLSLAWKVMTLDQKRPYEEMALRDKQRYEHQKQAYEAGYSAAVSQQAVTTDSPTEAGSSGTLTPSFEVQKTPPTFHPKRKRKDPEMPKRNMSAFMFYSKAKRPHLRAQNMTLRVGQLAQILAAQWKTMSPSDKAPFDNMAKKDKERYEVQLKAYRKGEYVPLSDQQDIDEICNMYQEELPM